MMYAYSHIVSFVVSPVVTSSYKKRGDKEAVENVTYISSTR